MTYDENGNYGHPDHINAARIAREAYTALAGGPDAVDALLRARMRRASAGRSCSARWPSAASRSHGAATRTEEAAAAGEASEAGETEEDEGFGRPDAEVTTRVDVSAFLEPEAAQHGLPSHAATGHGLAARAAARPRSDGARTETYVLRWRDGGDVPSTHREEWLLG